MLILRLAVVLAVLVMAGAIAAYLVTGQVRYRVYAWKTFKVLLAVVLVFMGLLALERVFAPLV